MIDSLLISVSGAVNHLRAPDQTPMYQSTDAAPSSPSLPAQLSHSAAPLNPAVSQDHSPQPQLPPTDAGKNTPPPDPIRSLILLG